MKRYLRSAGTCCCLAVVAGMLGYSKENPIHVSTVLPVNGATSVSVAVQIQITFNRPAMPNTLALENSPVLAYSLAWSNGNQTVTIIPNAPLAYASLYEITLTDVASDEDVWIEDYYAFSFTTEVSRGEGKGEGEGEGEHDYRQDMRDFVQAISAYAKAQHPGFIIIPQNGELLLTRNGLSDGPPSAEYIAAIDGQGREDVFYGYDADNQATPAAERDDILGFLDLAESEGVEVLVTDYCSTHAYMDNSYTWNAAHNFISFAANHRDLNNVPDYPASPYRVNPAQVSVLQSAQNFLYLIDPGAFASRNAFLNAVKATNHDLLILDFFYDDTALTAAELTGLKAKANGGSRPAIAYMSIGEAEDYRFYWQAGWQPGAPAWIEAENPDWEGNYKVRYWDPGWQAIIFSSPGAYLDRIMAAGFDGVYLDIIDGYEYFEDLGEGEGEGEGEDFNPYHTADQDCNNAVSLSELLRVIQFFNSAGYHCQAGTEDGYAPGPGDTVSCSPHASDYSAQNWAINLSELLRLIQFFNSNGYHACPDADPATEDGYCPGPA